MKKILLVITEISSTIVSAIVFIQTVSTILRQTFIGLIILLSGIVWIEKTQRSLLAIQFYQVISVHILNNQTYHKVSRLFFH